MVLVVAGGVVLAVTLARRAAGHPAVRFARDLAVSAFLIGQLLFRMVRFLVRFVVGEVRTWTPSR